MPFKITIPKDTIDKLNSPEVKAKLRAAAKRGLESVARVVRMKLLHDARMCDEVLGFCAHCAREAMLDVADPMTGMFAGPLKS